MRIILLLFAMCFAFILSGQVQRKPLIESFSNASCAPCAAQNPAFNLLLNSNKSSVTTLKFQMNWPGRDPMNAENPGDSNARRAFYDSFNAVPTTRLDGIRPGVSYGGGIGAWTANNPGAPAGYNQAVLDFAASQETYVSMEMSHEFNEDYSMAKVLVKIINTSDQAIEGSDLRLMLSMIEEVIDFPSPPGTTNERIFYNINRKLIPSPEGTSIELDAEAELSFEFEVEVPWYIYDLRRVGFVAFVQDFGTKLVLQSEVSPAIAVEGVFDIAATARTTFPGRLCESAVIPAVQVSNPGTETVTDITVLAVMGSIQETMVWNGELEAGQSITITGEELQAPIGATEIRYIIISVNGIRDLNRMNNLLLPVKVFHISPEVQGDSYDEGFEDTPNFESPVNTLIVKDGTIDLVVVDQTEFNDITRPIGGYGRSEKALLSPCYSTVAGVTASLVIQNLDFSEKSNHFLIFDRSYASYTGEADRLIVEVSTNCGGTWTPVFNRAGSQLATAPNNTNFFIPTPNQWVTDTINLSNLSGRDEVMIRFRTVSAFGNNIWVDNILIDGASVSTHPTFLQENQLTIFPNPTSDYIQMIVQLNEPTTANVELINSQGKVVRILGSNLLLNAGTDSLYFAIQEPPGMYFLRMSTPQGELTKRIVIVK